MENLTNFKRPTSAEVDKMNNASLKTTLKNVLKKFDEIVTALGNKAEEAEVARPNSTDTLLEKILDEMKKFNGERDSMNNKLDEVQQTNALLLETVSQQQRFLEEIDNEKRAKNLIVLGVPEKDLTVGGTTAKTDTEKIALILTAVGYKENVESVRRLGKLTNGATRARPIKVVLPSFEERQTILGLQEALEEVHGGALQNIKLKRDVHPAIRKEYGRLYEAERREKAKPDNEAKNVTFDPKKRVLLIDGQIVDRFKPSFF